MGPGVPRHRHPTRRRSRQRDDQPDNEGPAILAGGHGQHRGHDRTHQQRGDEGEHAEDERDAPRLQMLRCHTALLRSTRSPSVPTPFPTPGRPVSSHRAPSLPTPPFAALRQWSWRRARAGPGGSGAEMDGRAWDRLPSRRALLWHGHCKHRETGPAGLATGSGGGNEPIAGAACHQTAEGEAMYDPFGPFGPPGEPHIIRWHAPHEALILTSDGAPLAQLSLPPGAAPALAMLREPAGADGHELLVRALVWATEEHARGIDYH